MTNSAIAASPPRLTGQMILDAVGRLQPEVGDSPPALTQFVFQSIVRHFMGEDWLLRYVGPQASRKSYLFADNDAPEGPKIFTIRLMFLADLLFNLQDIEGLFDCLRPMREGNIEAIMAEVAIGMMLKQQGLPFRYIKPTQQLESDYDLELTYPDQRVACADVKCKVVETERSAKTIAEALKKARRQLPSDRPGIVFVKVPQEWLDPVRPDFRFTLEMLAAVNEFFGQTDRIVLVVFYVFHLDFGPEAAQNRHSILEYPNPKHRFDTNADWRLFAGEDFPDPFIDRNWTSVLTFTQPRSPQAELTGRGN